MPFLTSFLGRVPLLNKTDYRKKGILILTSLREGLADRIAFERLTCPNRGHLLHSPNWPPFVVSKGDIDQHKEGCNSLTQIGCLMANVKLGIMVFWLPIPPQKG